MLDDLLLYHRCGINEVKIFYFLLPNDSKNVAVMDGFVLLSFIYYQNGKKK